MVKIEGAGGRVVTSVPLVSLADLAEGKDTLDFDTLLGSWVYSSKAVEASVLTVQRRSVQGSR